MGSINQKSFKLLLSLLKDVSSDTIFIFGVKFDIFLVIRLFTSISAFVTDVLSDLIFFSSPFFLKSNERFPEAIKVSIKLLIILNEKIVWRDRK